MQHDLFPYLKKEKKKAPLLASFNSPSWKLIYVLT